MAQGRVGPQEALTGELRLELAAQLSEIARLVEAFEAFADRLRFPPAAVLQVTLVLDELVTNIVTHGVAPDQPEPITLDLSYDAGVLRIVISDAGRPFDPRTVATPDMDKSLEDREIGGLGVHIARSFMDSLDYRYEGGKNRLTLVKRIGGDAE
jgi:serine/threonine-protein kinase RsbW